MKIFVILLCFNLLTCCSDHEILDISYLKDNGYKEITCNSIERYQTEETNFVEVNKKLLNKKSFILARCFDKDSCLININFKKTKIVCQRYIVSRDKKYTVDYSHSDFKEFVDHRVLYLSVDDKDAKEFIERAN